VAFAHGGRATRWALEYWFLEKYESYLSPSTNQIRKI